ncbi:MAG: response regulator [Mariprofundaceae bacterium]
MQKAKRDIEQDIAPTPVGTVLVADNETDMREVLGYVFKQAGYSVLTAENGRQAVDLFLQHTDDITLVLMDLSMPVMDGLAAIREIRKVREKIAILLLTGRGEGEVASLLKSGLVDGILPKPFLLETVLQAADAAIQAAENQVRAA